MYLFVGKQEICLSLPGKEEMAMLTHFSVCEELPGHVTPPFCGLGWSQFRCLTRSPPLQLQLLHVDQLPHSPSTDCYG